MLFLNVKQFKDFINSSNKYLLGTYWLSDVVLIVEDTVGNKTDTFLTSCGLHSNRGDNIR